MLFISCWCFGSLCKRCIPLKTFKKKHFHLMWIIRAERRHTSLSADSQSAQWGSAPPAASPAAAARSAMPPLHPLLLLRLRLLLLLLLLLHCLHPAQKTLGGWEEARACGCCSVEHGLCSADSHTKSYTAWEGIRPGWLTTRISWQWQWWSTESGLALRTAGCFDQILTTHTHTRTHTHRWASQMP